MCGKKLRTTDSFGAAQMSCRESNVGAEHRKMISEAWISIVRLGELGPAITPILRRERLKMQTNEDDELKAS